MLRRLVIATAMLVGLGGQSLVYAQSTKAVDQKGNETQLRVNLTVPPKSPDELAEERHRRAIDLRMQWLLVAVGIITAGAIIWQTVETQRAAKAAEASANASLQELEQAHRPWLKVTSQLVGGFHFNPQNGATLTVAFTVENIGHSVAYGVDVKSAPLAPSSPHDKYLHEKQQEIIATQTANSPKESQLGYRLFPGEVFTSQQTMNIPLADCERMWSGWPDLASAPFNHRPLPVYVVGSVRYHYELSKAWHITAFGYTLNSPNPDRPANLMMTGESTPNAYLQIIYGGLGLWRAD